MDTKVCTGCKEEKSVEDFHLDKRWGIPRSRCKACCAAYNRTRPRSKADPAKAKASRKRWEDKNPGWRKAYQRAYNRQHAEKRNASRRKGGPGYERVLAERNKRRALLANAEGSHTVEEWLALCEAAGHRCLCCGKKRKLTRDHVVPLSEGGTDYIDNIQPLCFSCNASKGAKIVDYRNNDVCELPV